MKIRQKNNAPTKKKSAFHLDISEELVLEQEFLNSTQLIVAKKRRGKSYLAQVQAEELLAAKQQIVVLDPTGAWWGLRASADGKSAGYAITVFGGDHGDVPLEPTSGEVLATAIVEDGFSAVIDLTHMRKGERLRFAADFLETLYRKNRSAMHLFIDEADVFAPQVTRDPMQARLLGATDELVRRGGIRGIGVTLITQRTQVVSKDVISQIDTMMVLQMNHPKDIKAIKDWIVDHIDDEHKVDRMLASLPKLALGEAWFWAPEHETFMQIHVRKKRTFDSGRSPKPGERIKPPKKLAPVDLKKLGAAMAAAVEEAKANDPKALRLKIAELEKSLAAAKAAKQGKERIVEKKVEFIRPAHLKRLENLVKKIDKLIVRLSGNGTQLEVQLTGLKLNVKSMTEAANWLRGTKKMETMIVDVPMAIETPKVQAKVAPEPGKKGRAVPAPRDGTPPPKISAKPPAGAADLEPRVVKVLNSIAWWHSIGVEKVDSMGVAFVAGYSPVSTSFTKARGQLSSLGLISYPTGGTNALTSEGAKLATKPETAPTLAALHQAIYSKLEPRVAKMLKPLIDAYPNSITTAEQAEASGYSLSSTSYTKGRGQLRSLGLATYPETGTVKASDVLFPPGLK